jgi:hypothetical protein
VRQDRHTTTVGATAAARGSTRQTTGIGALLAVLLGGLVATAVAQDLPPPDVRGSSKKGKGGSSGASPAEFDRRAAEYYLALGDVKLASEYAELVLRRSFGFNDQSVSTALHGAHERVKQARARVSAGSDAPRRQVSAEIARSATAADRYVELVTKSIASAQSKNSWAGEPNDLFAQAVAVAKSLELSSETLRVLKGSASFAAALPLSERARLGLAKDPSGLDLDVGVLSGEPQVLFVVRKDGLADKLGFESGDRIVSAGGQALSSVWELQQTLAANAGKKVEVEVERKGKTKKRKISAPESRPAAGRKKGR